MILEIPDNILDKSNLTENELKMEFALFLFQNKIITLSQASNVANTDTFEFQKLLGRRKIPIHYDEQDLNEDLKTIKRIFG